MATILGGSFVSSVVSAAVYDPVFDTPMDANFIYQLLPSFYRTVMQDQELFSTVWSGMLQNQTADMLNLWQIDYAKSLRDVPVLAQRKWVQFDLFRTEDFEVDPVLETAGLGGRAFTHNEVTQRLDGKPINRARWDKAFVQLNGTDLQDTVDQATSLAWSIDINVESAQTFSGMLIGYFSSSKKRLSNVLAAALLGSEADEDKPSASLMHFDPAGLPTVSVGSFDIEIGVDYRFDAVYFASTGAVVLTITDLRKEKLVGTQGSIGEGFDAVFTNQFVDESVNFDSEGIVVADILVVFGSEFEIVSVDGFTLTVTPIGLPVDVDNVSYQILGEVEVGSVSMDLPGDAADPTFAVGQFGISSLDSRSITTAVFSAPSFARRKRIRLSVDNWRYLDPTVEETILSLPRLQDVIVDPELLLFEVTDFTVTVLDLGDPDTAPSTLKFQEPPLEPLWAEYVAYDEQYIRNNFGRNVGLNDISSDQYKARVRGLYYAYFQGPTLAAIRTGVHILIGLPIAEVAGTVDSINPAFSGTLGLITIADRDYLYPLLVGTELQVGDEVDLFEPLSLGVEVIDYVTTPEWFVASNLHELQKFHSFQVALNLDAFDIETLTLAGIFVDQIKPTWKQARYLGFKDLVDEVDMSDAIALRVGLVLFDTFCNAALVAYDDHVFEGDEEDWKYDQGLGSWNETSAAIRGTSLLLGGTVVVNNGDTVVTGVGTTWLSDIGGPGAVAGRFVALGIYTTGSTGETTAGSFLFLDNTNQAFAGLLVDDHIEITGEGTFEIHSIDRNVFSAGPDGTFTTATQFDDPNATFQSDGLQIGDSLLLVGGFNDGLEFEVSSVPSETQITISTPATPSLVDSGSGGFVTATAFEEAGALWQTNGVQSGDILVIGGAGVNAGSEFEVGTVLDEDTLTIIGAASISAAEPYTIERRDAYTVERENQLTLDSPLGFSNINVDWEVVGELAIWAQVSSVASDTSLTFLIAYPGTDQVYKLARINNNYRRVFYDRFEELCPDERFTMELEYTNGAAPGVTTVPASDPTLTTTFNFAVIGDTYTVTLDEPTP